MPTNSPELTLHSDSTSQVPLLVFTPAELAGLGKTGQKPCHPILIYSWSAARRKGWRRSHYVQVILLQLAKLALGPLGTRRVLAAILHQVICPPRSPCFRQGPMHNEVQIFVLFTHILMPWHIISNTLLLGHVGAIPSNLHFQENLSVQTTCNFSLFFIFI